jgi:hypothetical protein
MKNLLAMLAMCSGLVAIPGAIFAADAMSSQAVDATMMCRPAMSGEKATAMMGSKAIVCKAIPKMPMSKMGPDTTGMDATQAAAAWHRWLSLMMAVPETAGGGAGG